MNLRTVPRFALDSYLKAVKWPLKRAIRMAGRNGAANSAEIALDRADATARGLAGTVTGDPELKRDATRRHTAADQRERAQRLRSTAEEISERSDAELQHRRDQADSERKKAERERKARSERAVQAQSKRKAANAKATALAETAIDEKAKLDRLDALDEKAAALEKTEGALTARDEEQRLAGAAAKAKSARKAD